jgi:hypothetical protein
VIYYSHALNGVRWLSERYVFDGTADRVIAASQLYIIDQNILTKMA